MWNEIVTKIGALKTLDQQYQVFGAEHHRYEIFPPVDPYDLEEFESRLRFSLPAELREFYLNVGHGIAGPHYGLLQLHELESYAAEEPYTEVVALREIARQRGYVRESGDYFEVERGELTGLVSIIGEGCGHELCLVTNGRLQGTVVRVSADGYVHETNQSLTATYEEWVGRELEKFSTVEHLMRSNVSLDKIVNQVQEQFGTLDAEDVMISIANAEKPVELFGTTYNRIYHGATQTPWYEGVLREWRQRNNVVQ